MKRTAVINIVGLTSGLIGDSTKNIQAFVQKGSLRPIKPAFPAVTCTAQSNYLTGKSPSEHGIVGNGWYNREYSEIHFWKQSNKIVQQRKIWDELKEENPDFTCAKLFWWYNMYSGADYSITPRPMYPADGRKFFDVYSEPMHIRDDIKKDTGDFPFHTFWGPRAGIESSQWIAESAKWIENKYSPTLNLIYLPHLDYNLQRIGPNNPEIHKDLEAIDCVVGDLINFFENKSIEVVLLSEYGITEVNRPIHINRILRDAGMITIKDELGLEMLDCGASKAFAVADHQIAHIYVNDPEQLDKIKGILENTEGIDQVLGVQGKAEAGIDHERSGDLIAVSDEKSWFTYYYWQDDAVAPDFARCVDIHRKAGYDPVELFIDPEIPIPFFKIAKFLLKKKLGFRVLLDVIPLDAELVKGSHGCIPSNIKDYPILVTSQKVDGDESGPLNSTSIYPIMKSIINEGRSN